MRKTYQNRLLFLLLCFMVLCLSAFYIRKTTSSLETVQLRKFPYPYRAMLSFTSDIDGTTPEEFVQYHRFLNTREQTPMGVGLGLDIGDSFWMYTATNTASYVDNKKRQADAVMTYFHGIDPTRPKDAKRIKYYWQVGWIDSIHSYGDFSRQNKQEGLCTRNLARTAWQEMKQAGIQPEIWINHGNQANKQNFGSYRRFGFTSYQAGDNPHSPFYHTDITVRNGVRFVWNSYSDYSFGTNNAIFPLYLRDGNRVWGFHRYGYNRTAKGTQWTWGPGALYLQLTPEHLNGIMKRGQYSIVAQHFGGGVGDVPFSEPNRQALRLLATYYHNGDILVARTSRLLRYNLVQQYIRYATIYKEERTQIQIKALADPLFGYRRVRLDEIRGLTFYVKDPSQTDIFLGKYKLTSSDIQINPPDQTGRASISIKWFAPDVFDYSATAPHL